uniref:Neuronal membrane glycoprotein M6-b n=1 Tax=Elaeophora elaphi TaxID=1147741 RepID=A0A0R3S4S7_9BILA
MGFRPMFRHHSGEETDYEVGDECLSRVPYASVIATSMCGIGVILFTLVMTWAFNASVEQARRILLVQNIPWLAKMQVLFVCVAILMAIAALILLVIAAMSTGSTRKELYRGVRGRMGGKLANAFSLVTAYLLNMCWLVCFAIVVVLCFVYYVFTFLCSSISFRDSDCLDFSLFQPFIRQISTDSLKLCGGDVQQFCALSWSAFAWYLVSLISCLIVIKGLEHFMMCSSANYAHISSGLKYLELRELLLSGDGDTVKADLRTSDYQMQPRIGNISSPDYGPLKSYLVA